LSSGPATGPVRRSRCRGHSSCEILEEKVAAILDDPSEVVDEIRSLFDVIRS
jgi:hypothetical protein